jgi:hypothetical protein
VRAGSDNFRTHNSFHFLMLLVLFAETALRCPAWGCFARSTIRQRQALQKNAGFLHYIA